MTDHSSEPIRLISFGHLHLADDAPLQADRVEDVRVRLHDPAVHPDILDLDGLNPRVQQLVERTPGALALLDNLVEYAVSPAPPSRIAIGCAGGRHRAPALVALLAVRLSARGRLVDVEHRHIHLPRVLRGRST